jgi:hypothetical protein
MKDGKKLCLLKENILNIEPGMVLQYTAFGPNGKLEDIPANYTRYSKTCSS